MICSSFLEYGEDAAPAHTDAGEVARVVADVVQTALDNGKDILAVDVSLKKGRAAGGSTPGQSTAR